MPMFVGRAHELELAQDGLRHAGRVVLIHGPGGIGKTRLLREALDGLEGGLTLHGRANQLDAELAFAPLIDAITHHLDGCTPAGQLELLEGLDDLGELLPGYGLPAPPVDAQADRDRIRRTRRLDALRRLVSRLDGTPVRLVIDDAHWADDSTLGALAHLSRSLGDGPLTIALTFRDADAGPLLRTTLTTLRRAARVVDLGLGPVDEDAVAAILSTHLDAPPAPSLTQLVRDRAAGNTLAVTSLARHLRDEGLVRPGVDGRLGLVPGTEPGVPAEITDMLAARRDRVSDPAGDVLGALGAADAPTTLDVLAEVTGHPLEVVEDAVDELVAAALAEEDGRNGTVAAAHPLIGEAAYEALGERRRARLHAAFVAVLERAGEVTDVPTGGKELGRLARHHRLAGRRTDPGRAIDVLGAAAVVALRRYAPREALLHAQAAVDIARRSAARPLPPLLGQLGVVWRRLNEDETADAVIRSAIDMVDEDEQPELAVELLAQRATVLYYMARPEESMACLERATAIDPAGAVEAGVPWRKAHLAFSFGISDALQAVAAEVLDGTDPLVTDLIRAMAAQDRGDFDTAVELATPLADSGEDTLLQGMLLLPLRASMVLIQVSAFRGSSDTIRARIASVDAYAEAVQTPAVRWRVVLSQLLLAHLTGHDETVEEHLRVLGSYGRARAETMRGYRAITALPLAWRGDSAALVSRSDDPSLPPADADTCLNDLKAIAAARRGEDDPSVDLRMAAHGHSVMPPLNRAARALLAVHRGDTGRATEEIARLRAMGGPDTVPGVLADLATIHLDAVHPDVDPAALAARGADAADRVAALDLKRLEAWVARAVAQLLVDRDASAAVPLAHRAVDIATDLGDRLDVDAAQAVLRAAGVRRSHHRRSAGPLTARQQEIAQLVAEGLTNADIAERLFVSVRTVTTHLDHVYQRLGISSRHALAVRVRDHDLEVDRIGTTADEVT
ncbi:regulatory protein, LuxR [Euzebya pacifica]|uniref:Regulatory protein, LuxR n=1 Tax=Euzebya pacifica TaxID=1608957 RepID=A0A346XRT2_9ACTN|nr:AAA family ATPase [Euzebya pacifica]AXV04929.1 regulatory protein, LuxR [Euzebya pacifica]